MQNLRLNLDQSSVNNSQKILPINNIKNREVKTKQQQPEKFCWGRRKKKVDYTNLDHKMIKAPQWSSTCIVKYINEPSSILVNSMLGR